MRSWPFEWQEAILKGYRGDKRKGAKKKILKKGVIFRLQTGEIGRQTKARKSPSSRQFVGYRRIQQKGFWKFVEDNPLIEMGSSVHVL